MFLKWLGDTQRKDRVPNLFHLSRSDFSSGVKICKAVWLRAIPCEVSLKFN
ncbi:hypothetical protein S7335_5000 [Synechococcus sp. PCC 7335]|nr:hypothetical protein S7335_5000 [Synechococcus sp. PCC 7335]